MQTVLDKFTTYYKKSIVAAYGRSLALKKKQVDDEDLFWAILTQKGSLGYETLIKAGLKQTYPAAAKVKIDVNQSETLDKIIANFKNITLSKRVKQIIIDSIALAARYHHNYVGTEHLLYSLIRAKTPKVNKILQTYHINPQHILKNMEIIFNSTSKFAEMAEAINSLSHGKDELLLGQRPKKESLLNFFAHELTNPKVQESINPVIGREKEIERIIQILCRRDKNNPVLLGEPGVGKTAIIEGLSKKILEGDVPEVLLDKKIYALDMPLLVAGTSYRGEFEARIKQIVDEVKADKNIILFIDEIHNIIGAGSTTGTMDAANILKPALARGEIRCIGATTFDDYKKYIEPDNALSRRLQKVIVNEPTPQEAIEILKGIRSAYERHHSIKITDEAIQEAVRLSVKYLTDQFLPDKAIDLIDEAASRKRVKAPQSINIKKINSLQKKLSELNRQKQKLVNQAKYNEALRLKSKEIEIINQIYKLEEEQIKSKIKIKLKAPTNQTADKITAKDIQELVAASTRIDLSSQSDSLNVVKQLKKKLKQKIIGQDEVIEQIAQTLKRSVAGLAGESRPLGSFIFAGPSGVGKTYTAKVLAELISPHNKNALIKIDMSEYGEKFNASKLIGAPAGYVGYNEGGQLTEKVKHNPYSVILLDEIEKAHPDIFNLFLQILEDGYLTDSKGRQVNFKNTIIIMTTNIGLEKEEQAVALGFGEEKHAELVSNYQRALQEWLRPELLNRIDQILIFNKLTPQDLLAIINLELSRLASSLAEKKIHLSWTRPLVKLLAAKCQPEKQGARIVRDVLRTEIEGRLADKILSAAGQPLTINLTVKNSEIILD